MVGGGLAGTVGLAVKPERRSVKLNDRCVGPELCGLENTLGALIEAQQTRGKVVRRGDGSGLMGGHIQAAGVFHRATLSPRRVAVQSGCAGQRQARHWWCKAVRRAWRSSDAYRPQSTAGARGSLKLAAAGVTL